MEADAQPRDPSRARGVAAAREAARASRTGASAQLWEQRRRTESARVRLARGVRPVYKRVDTCGAEFEAHTPYLYSTYEAGVRGARRRAARRS